MEFYGIKITIDELIKICSKLSDHIKKDRNTLCLVLDFANKNVQDWYKEINDKFSPWIGNGIKMELSQAPKDLFSCVNNNDRKIVADKLQTSLQDVVNKSNKTERDKLRHAKRSELRHKLFGFLRYDLKVGEVDAIVSIIEDFNRFKIEREDKIDWLKSAVERETWDVSPRVINEWITDVRNIEENIIKSIAAAQSSIGCNTTSYEDLFNDFRK